MYFYHRFLNVHWVKVDIRAYFGNMCCFYSIFSGGTLAYNIDEQIPCHMHLGQHYAFSNFHDSLLAVITSYSHSVICITQSNAMVLVE